MTAKTRGLLCCVGCVLNIGFAFLCTNLVGLFCVPLASNLGVEYSSIALIWTSLSIGSICSRFFAGRLFDKVNPKIICAVSAVMYLFALPGMTLVKSPTAAIILFFFVGIINAFTGTLPFQLLGSKWIGVGRGTVIGLAPIFSAIFDMVFAPIGAAFATEYGFERTALAAGAILCLLHILVSLICISKEPQGLFSFHPVLPHCTRARWAGPIRVVPRASYAEGVALGTPENPTPLPRLGPFWKINLCGASEARLFSAKNPKFSGVFRYAFTKSGESIPPL